MKNQVVICLMAMSLGVVSMSMNAQIKVANTGKVGVGIADTINPQSLLSVGCQGSSDKVMAIEQNAPNSSSISTFYNLYSMITLTPSPQQPDWNIALSGYSKGTTYTDRLIGVEGVASKTVSNSGYGRSYGVIGKAGRGTAGWNYGVIGLLQSESDWGAGVYGGLSNGSEGYVGGRYAGYFKGQTKVDGDFYATTVNTTSDARLKTNISDVETSTIQKIRALHPIRFNWRQVEDIHTADTAQVKRMYLSEDTDYNRSHYGFIAQDVKELFPDLVHEDADGYMSVNYIELIPLLVQAVQELSTEVAELKEKNIQSRKNK